jgi:hypothetical protein
MQTSAEATMKTCHWTKARFDEEVQHARTNIHPEHWPADVRSVSPEGLTYLGLDRKGRLYLDGEPVYTAKRWETYERALATVGLFLAALGTGAAAFSAYADWRQQSATVTCVSVSDVAPRAKPVLPI